MANILPREHLIYYNRPERNKSIIKNKGKQEANRKRGKYKSKQKGKSMK